ncbi:MAG: aldehyde dehydrogenase family protein [Nocardioidaceae bacterium]
MPAKSTESLIEDGRKALARAETAGRTFATYDRDAVMRVVRAVTTAAEANAERLAYAAVEETGFGVAADKITKNLAIARDFIPEYAHLDFCGHRADAAAKILSVPKPAGVVFAVLPSTGPVAALYFKVLCAMLTRNAIVLSPHPAAAKTGVDAAQVLADAATGAGAPADVIQVLPHPSIPLVEAMMGDERTKLVIATGGAGVVRTAYHSGTPAIGVGPGNPPVIVDDTADLTNAAASIVRSKAFDNSILCTAESVLFVVDSVADDLKRRLQREGAYLCNSSETDRVRDLVYPRGAFDPAVVGRFATELARFASVRVPTSTRLLVTPIARIHDGESLTHEKLCPVLALRRVPSFEAAVREAKELVDIVGVGHSAVIHTDIPQRVLDFAGELPVHRITVNAPGSVGNAGIGTGLPLTMSVGTGFIGGCSTADNLNPEHFVQWSRTTYASDSAVRFPDFTGLRLNQHDGTGNPSPAAGISEERLQALIREDLRKIVLEELRELMAAH